MDHVGEPSEPQDEEPPPSVAEGGDGEPPPTDAEGPDGEPPGGPPASEFPLVAVGIVALVVLLGLVGWLIGRGDGLFAPIAGPDVTTESTVSDSTAVDESVTTSAPTSVAPTVSSSVAPTTALTTTPATTTPTTLAPTTVAVTTAPPVTTTPGGIVAATIPSTAPPTVPSVPGEDPIDDVVDIVPNLAASPNYINILTELEAVVAELVATPRHDVSSLTPVATLCVAVQLEAPVRVSGRWELDGRPLASMEARDVPPPGFGDCVNNEGDPMEGGAYQFIAVDADGDESAAGTFVAGAARVDQRFLNNGGRPVCAILLSPATADFFEAFRFDIPVGGDVTIPIADVSQDVRALGCTDPEPLAEFRFDPSSDEARDLID